MKLRIARKVYWALWREESIRQCTARAAVARFRRRWRLNVAAALPAEYRILPVFPNPLR